MVHFFRLGLATILLFIFSASVFSQADTTAPTVSSATVDRTALVITFDETLAPAANLANGAFTVKKTPSGGSEQTESLSGSPSISAATVTLTLADVVAHNDTGVKVSYTKPTSGSNNKLQDAADNEVAGFTDRAVTNNTAQAPAPTNLAAGNTTGNYTNLTWDEPADDGNGAVGGYNVYRCAVADGDTTCTPAWIAWVQPNWHNYYADDDLSAGATYRYAVGSSRGDGTNSAWSNVVTVMTLPQAPAPTGLTVTATTTTSISLGWSAPADDGKGAITGYNVYSCEEGMTVCTPVWVAWVDGASTTSYTHSSLTTGQEYRYAVGASRGGGTESVFSDQVTATAQAPDTTAPTVSSATVDGTALVITFDETLAPAASLANGAFTVKKTPSGGSEQTESLSGSPSISGATVTLTLAAAAVHTDTGVKISYTKPASGSNNKLQDAADNEVAGFTDRAVANETADPTAPAVSSATVDGTALVITFNETLAAAANLANSAFAVKKTPSGGSEQTVGLSGSPSISGATVTLTLAAAAVHTDTGVKVSYTKPGLGQQQQAAGRGGQRGGQLHRPGGDQQHGRHHGADGELGDGGRDRAGHHLRRDAGAGGEPGQQRLCGEEDAVGGQRADGEPERVAVHQRRHGDADPGRRGGAQRHGGEGQLHQAGLGQQQQAAGCGGQRGDRFHRPGGDQQHRASPGADQPGSR